MLSRALLSDEAIELKVFQYDINIVHTPSITEPKLQKFKNIRIDTALYSNHRMDNLGTNPMHCLSETYS